MTDIREKVARAIYERQSSVAIERDLSPNELAAYLPLADAALSACGYQEMRAEIERLSKLVNVPGLWRYPCPACAGTGRELSTSTTTTTTCVICLGAGRVRLAPKEGR